MSNAIKLVFLGDIVGRPGRFAVKYFMENIEDYLYIRPDFVIANCENASHGFGLTEKNYNDLIGCGIDVLTSGNHIWDKKEIFNYIDRADYLIRPFNYPEGTPGKGYKIFKKNGFSIGVLNFLGRIFMDPYESPWRDIKNELLSLQSQTPVIIVDFHAEATAEKIAFGYHLADLGVTAMLGTHTHVQTADQKIINNSTAYISDVGFCGATTSVIGMDVNTSIKRLSSLLPTKYEVADIDEACINGVLLSINKESGTSESIERINFTINLKDLIAEGKI